MDTFREFATQGTDDQLEPGLFDKIYTEVSVTISSDIWPRYKDAVLKGENIGNSAVVGSQGTDGSGLVDFGKASKQAVAALLRIPYKLEILRHVAQAQGVRENVEFCVQCQSYKMLFSEDDRKPRAKVIWDTFMAAGADTPVNIADNLIKETKPKALAAEPDAFEVAYDEVLRIISDNLFAHFMKALECEEARKAMEAVSSAPPPAPPSSGRCCLLM